jgi:hypothetical protein
MLVYRCAHCGEILGPITQETMPVCENHPDGIVEVYEDGDTQPQ